MTFVQYIAIGGSWKPWKWRTIGWWGLWRYHTWQYPGSKCTVGCPRCNLCIPFASEHQQALGLYISTTSLQIVEKLKVHDIEFQWLMFQYFKLVHIFGLGPPPLTTIVSKSLLILPMNQWCCFTTRSNVHGNRALTGIHNWHYMSSILFLKGVHL